MSSKIVVSCFGDARKLKKIENFKKNIFFDTWTKSNPTFSRILTPCFEIFLIFDFEHEKGKNFAFLMRKNNVKNYILILMPYKIWPPKLFAHGKLHIILKPRNVKNLQAFDFFIYCTQNMFNGTLNICFWRLKKTELLYWLNY